MFIITTTCAHVRTHYFAQNILFLLCLVCSRRPFVSCENACIPFHLRRMCHIALSHSRKVLFVACCVWVLLPILPRYYPHHLHSPAPKPRRCHHSLPHPLGLVGIILIGLCDSLICGYEPRESTNKKSPGNQPIKICGYKPWVLNFKRNG